jgi:hypothetical protein
MSSVLQDVLVRLRKFDTNATVQIRETLNQYNQQIFKVKIDVPSRIL